MTTNNDDLQDVSMNNTKKEILAAFNELKKKMQEQSETELKPEQKKEEKRKTEIIQTADRLTGEGTIVKINELKIEIGKTLTQISDRLEEETANYLKLKESIQLKKEELKEIYDIEESAYALAVLIEAQKQKKQAFEEEISHRKELLETEISQKRLEWEKEKQVRDLSLKEQDAEEKKIRERQREEFQYNFKREQQLSQNAFKDQKEKMEKELAEAQEEFDKKVIEMEKNLKAREDKVLEREKKLDELQKQVDQFPIKLEDEVNKAVNEVTERLTLESQKNEALLKKGYEGETNVLKTKIQSLEQTVIQQSKQIEDLSNRLEKSYGKVQDIAVKAIEGSASSQRFSNFEQQMLLDRKSKQTQESKD